MSKFNNFRILLGFRHFLYNILKNFIIYVTIITGGAMDVYELLFKKMYLLGFPDKYEGYKMIYYFKEFEADLKLMPTEYKIKKMWELLK